MSSRIVLLHAFPLDSRMWQPVAADLRVDGWEVVLVDLPGFGGTSVPEEGTDLSVVARAISGVVTEGSVVAGVSLGGYVVMEMMRQALGGTGVMPRGIALIDTKASADLPDARAGRLDMAAQAERDPGALGESLRARLLPGLLGHQPEPAVEGLVGGWLDEAPAAAVAWYQRAMADRPESFTALGDLRIPCLVLWGEEDALSPEVEQRAMLEVLRNGSEGVIEGAGHLSCVERPAAVSAAFVEWLDTLR